MQGLCVRFIVEAEFIAGGFRSHRMRMYLGAYECMMSEKLGVHILRT